MVHGKILMRRKERVRSRPPVKGVTRGEVALGKDIPGRVGRVVFGEGWVVFEKVWENVIVISIAIAFATVSTGGKEVFAAAWRGRAYEERPIDG
jgi:hypothetical protein